MEIETVKVKFSDNNTLYDFSPNGLQIKKGDYVVIDTEKGKEIGEVFSEIEKTEYSHIPGRLINILRIATKSDLADAKKYSEQANLLKPAIQRVVQEKNLDMKIIKVDANLDNSKLLIIFSSEERVDFRELVKELASLYKKKIELRQIGARDEVRILGGYGVCGKECCCCQNFGQLAHVSIKMAKTQNLSLSPENIRGVCGKLLCCLSYENEVYTELLERMPKINSFVQTKEGRGKVIYNDVLAEKVSVKFEDETGSKILDFKLSDIVIDGNK